MPLYTELLDNLRQGREGRLETTIPEDWMQGRTTYGGLTAALCLESAKQLVDDLPVRTAQIAFIGPVGGEIVISPKILRRGKSSAYVNVDLVTEDGIAARAIFCFGAPRESSLDVRTLPAPEVKAPETLDPLFSGGLGPQFTQHFDMRLAGGHYPVSGADKGDLSLWIRHMDEGAPLDATALLSIADTPPPAAMTMFKDFAPISSMTWMAEFLSEGFDTEDGWWLARSVAETALNGYSSQAMTLWNRAGIPVMVGRQTVAIFA